MARSVAILPLLLLASLLSNVDSQCVKCPEVDENAYNIHLIPHSHMDMGWLKTVEQYYYGANQNVTTDAVQYIYDSVLEELQKDPQRRFIAVETGFFRKWWTHRSEKVHSQFKRLLQAGQIEFIGGGFVMNDEAGAHYENIIDQMSHGLNILQDLFGVCGVVETGWQIDPFGHSKQFALALHKMGFKQLFFGRMDYQEKNFREQQRNMEFSWQLEQGKNITVTTLPNMYAAPKGFCYDLQCTDPIIVPDEDSPEYNLKDRADQFMDWVRNTSNYYRSNNLVVTMGEDFCYKDASIWFKNMDLLMNYINSKQYTVTLNGKALRARTVYSTPTCYSRASAQQKFTENKADFFPYAYPDGQSFWTGYFVSRPSFKFLVRWSSGVYRAITQILAELGAQVSLVSTLRDALAIAQHHDAITGTAKQFVNDNYADLLLDGVKTAYGILEKVFGKKIEYCPKLNISTCDATENLQKEGIVAVVYNPLAFNVSTYVRLPVKDANVEIVDENNNALTGSFGLISDAVFNLAERISKNRFEVTIPVQLPAMGFRQIKMSARRQPREIKSNSAEKLREETIVQAGHGVEVGIGVGGIQWIRANGKTTKVSQTFGYYKSSCKDGSRASGAYVFRPDGAKVGVELNSEKKITSDLFTEVQQTYSNGVAQNIRIYKDQPYVELDWIVGPIDVSDKIGKEFVTTLHSDIFSNASFYTDSNGRDHLIRIRDHRDNWALNLTESISGNYYPINSRIGITDGQNHLTILTDRAQAASSLQSGSLEVMIHRRCLCDDHFGVDEPLSEPGVDGKGLQVRGTFRVFIGENPSRQEDLKMTSPLIFFSEEVPTGVGILNTKPWEGKLHVLTLNTVADKLYLLRLENLVHETLSVDFTKLFTHRFVSVQETDLAGLVSKGAPVSGAVTFQKGDIKTFLIKL